MISRIPIIEIAYNTDRLRMRCPYGKAHSLFTVLLNKVSTQHFVGMKVGTLVKQE